MAAKKENMVISGISGRFPECLNMKQFRERILAGDCLISHDDSRWPMGLYNLPTGSGKIRQIEDFDAEFFGYNDEQADLLDPLDRLLITEAHSAILDAGVLPESLRGSNTGFFFGSFVDQVQSALKDDFDAKESIFQWHASRIHEALDLRGPSIYLENGCATSMTALQIACNSIANGLCDQALVGGVNIPLDPTRVNWQMLYETLSADSTCHVFDIKASGYVKGEAAVVIFVQKKSQAKRIYAEILGNNVNADGYKQEGYTYPGWRTQRDLMLGAMGRAGISGKDFAYFEAHGTGTQAGDKTEARSIYEAICCDREGEPLMVGSIKSITGHAEGASGLVSMAKIIIAYQTKTMAPNLFYVTPNPNIPYLTDGTFNVITKPAYFEGGICGINNFGIGGGNGSVVINSFNKAPHELDYDICSPIPRLMLTFGRNQSMVVETLGELEKNAGRLTRGFCSILNDISSMSPRRGMASRGYLIIDNDKRSSIKKAADVLVGTVGNKDSLRPVWLIFSGLGSQWCGMAKQLMSIKLFSNSVHRSIKYLAAGGYDNQVLRDFIIGGVAVGAEKEPMIVSITIIQIALFDMLTELGLQVDGIVGHSIGEIAAAYADGCITWQEALAIARTSEEALFYVQSKVPGTMVAVGLAYADALEYRFGTVDVACSNSAHMVTMAGTEADMKSLCAVLTDRKIFVHPVESNGITAHTHFIRNSFTPHFKQLFGKLSLSPKQCSARFVSTSVEESPYSQNSSCLKPDGHYFAHNLLHPVHFYDAIRNAPKHTLFVEIGPTAQLHSLIRNSFKADHEIHYTQLLRRASPSNVGTLLNAIGILYTAGQNIDLNPLYPKVEYPVTRNTEFLSPILRYDHSKPRMVPKYPRYFCPSAQTRSIYEENVSLHTETYFSDHSVDGLVLYPGTGYLYLAWKAIATFHGSEYMKFPVEFRKVNISRATKLSDKETQLKCTYFADTGSFAIEANNNVCTTGFIYPLAKNFKFLKPVSTDKPDQEVIILDRESFYRELHVRGYHFGEHFQNVLRIRDDSRQSLVRWTDNIITYLDSILQSSVLQQPLRLLYVPTLIEAMQVDPIAIKQQLRMCSQFGLVSDVFLDQEARLIHAAGVQVLNAGFKPISRKLEENPNAELIVESLELLGYDETDAIDAETKETITLYVNEVRKLTEKLTRGDTIDQLNDSQIKARNHGLWLAVKSLHFDQTNSAEPQKDLTSLSTELDCDILHSSITSDRFFRTQLDVVIENVSLYNKLNVLEINTSAQLIYPKLIKVVGRPLFGFNMANLIYTIAHSRTDSLPEEILTNKLIQLVHFDQPKTRFPYRDLERQEFVIYRDPRISLSQIDAPIDFDMLLRSIEMTLADNGFLLAFLRESMHPVEQVLVTQHQSEKFKLLVEQFVKFAEEAGLVYVGKKSDTFTCCSLLFRKVPQMSHNEQFIEILNNDLNWLEPLKKANRDESITRIWLHSREPLSGIFGLTRALAKDISRNKAKYLFFDRKSLSLEKALVIARKTQLLQNAFIGDQLGSFRHITFSERPEMVDNVHEFELRQIKTGDLSSFRPFASPTLTSLGYKPVAGKEACGLGPDASSESRQILVDVHKAPLNFRDVMIATARMSPSDVSNRMAWDDVVLGLEFAGRIRANGKRVMGFANCKALATSIIANKEFLWPVPEQWSLLQASTVPVVYATCYYGLIIRGQLQQGESVLIHAGTGGVGLAAINICLAMKCRVFTTAGTREKRDFLRKTYPQIEPECIGNSRDCSFHTMVMQQTKGRGVDLILNSLTDDMFWASLRCLANNGRFCEIGKYQFMNDDFLDVSLLLRNKSFHGVHLDRLFPDGAHGALLTPKAIRERKQIWRLLSDGIKSGVVQPLPCTVFAYEQVESAFRFMSTGKHIGKVVVQFGLETSAEVRKEIRVRAVPKSYFEPSKSYIIAGGLGGMGLELMFWMQERGARKFVLTSRGGVKTPTHKYMIKQAHKLDCTILVSTEDGSKEEGARKVVQKAESLGPIGGIFLSTLVLENESIDKITVQMYQKVMYAKSTQAIVFDKVLRQLGYPLDYFVGFSSIAAGRGFPGQTNYAFANSILERVCDLRRKDGLHGLAIQWGMIGDVGYVADHVAIKDSIRGYKPQAIISCWQWLDRCIQSPHSVVGSFVRIEDSLESVSMAKISLIDHVCNIMGIKDKTKLEPKATLADLGLDSMMATEIGNVFENEFHVALTAKDIRAMTIEKITEGFES